MYTLNIAIAPEVASTRIYFRCHVVTRIYFRCHVVTIILIIEELFLLSMFDGVGM